MLSAGPSRSRQQLTIGNHLAAARRFIKPALASYHVCTAIAPRRVVPVMVEGHQCHRVGHAHGRLLLGKRFIATSPNGRFAEGQWPCLPLIELAALVGLYRTAVDEFLAAVQRTCSIAIRACSSSGHHKTPSSQSTFRYLHCLNRCRCHYWQSSEPH